MNPNASPLAQAARHLYYNWPEYFVPRSGRPAAAGCCIPHPNLLTESVWNGKPMRDIVMPACLKEIPLATWKELYQGFIRDYLKASPDMRAIVALGIAEDLHLTPRQQTWFLPNQGLHDVRGLGVILSFLLCGAILAGARLEDLGTSSFLVGDDEGTWGIQNQRETATDTHLHRLSYRDVVAGTYWKGAKTRQTFMARVYLAACKAGNDPAREALSAIYWNINRPYRLKELIGYKGEK
jgi:hypothetical protein